MLNESDESRHPCLVPDLRGNAFSFSLLSMMLAVGWSYMGFIIMMYGPSIPILLRAFIINEFFNLILFIFLYSRFLLVIHLIHISV